MEPIKENETPSTGSPENSISIPGAVSLDSNESSEVSSNTDLSGEQDVSSIPPQIEQSLDSISSNPVAPQEETMVDGPAPVVTGPAPVVTGPVSESLVENPPFLQSTSSNIAQIELPTHLKQAVNFRKTLKHKKRSDYERLSDNEKMVAKKKIVDNLIHVLRSSTQKTTYNNHKKSILKLRHTLNKHLDYIEKKKRVKSVKKEKIPKTIEKNRRSKSIR